MQGAFASRFNVPAQLLAPIPDGVSAVDAATIPAAALTVRLAFDWAKLKPGDRVLIHAASGGVGLAAIQMAQQHGAIVFATASTYKRATLRKMGVEYVYDSRTTDFADQILADTDGAGVDVVLNSLTNEGFVEATVRATAKNGRFAEIAKRDIWTPEQMAAARPDIDYEIVALDVTIMPRARAHPRLADRGVGRVGQGRVDATARRDLPADGGQGRVPPHAAGPAHRQDRAADAESAAAARRSELSDHRRTRCDRSAHGGVSGPTRRRRHRVDQPARARTPRRNRQSRRSPSATSAASTSSRPMSATSRRSTKLLERIRAELPPLAGVAHLAGVLDDALLSQQDLERFRTTLAPKAFGACHLDRLTKDDELDFFIVSSSVSSLLGSPGQANYATANALLDGLVARTQGARPARHRRQLRSLGPGRHGLLGGRAAPISAPRA